MNKTVTIALASLLALSPMAGVAYAQDTMATGAIATDNVSIVLISSLEEDDAGRADALRLKNKMNDPASLEAAQAELQADPALTQVLASKNVQLQNVVEIKTAADGGKIVYVK